MAKFGTILAYGALVASLVFSLAVTTHGQDAVPVLSGWSLVAH